MSSRRSEIRDHRPVRFQIPPLSLRESSRPEPSRYPPLGYGYGHQVHASPYDPILPGNPPLSLRQGSRPEHPEYPPLNHGYGTQIDQSPYDPIVPGNRNPYRLGESAGYKDEDEDVTPTVVRNTRKRRRRLQTD